ncbi:MAG: phosphatase PAP2 family protein [Candidatus Diapherotrites archaeon]
MTLIPLDYTLLHLIQLFYNQILDYLMIAITELGSPLFWFLVASMLYWKGKEKDSFYLTTLLVFTGIIIIGLKDFFMRARPSSNEFRVLVKSSEYSFPSGHATTISSVAAFYERKVKSKLTIMLILAVLIVSYSRLYVGAHFPSDVIVGIALGLLIGKACKNLFKRFDKAQFKLTSLEEEIIVIILIAIALILLLLASPIPEAALFIGYYAGFFVLKETRHTTTQLTTQNMFIKQFIGFMVMAAIGIPALLIPAIDIPIKFILLFMIGLWVTLLMPLLYEKILKTELLQSLQKEGNL